MRQLVSCVVHSPVMSQRSVLVDTGLLSSASRRHESGQPSTESRQPGSRNASRTYSWASFVPVRASRQDHGWQGLGPRPAFSSATHGAWREPRLSSMTGFACPKCIHLPMPQTTINGVAVALGAEGDAAWPSTNRAARDSAPKPDGSIAPTLQLPPRWDDDGQPHLGSACQVFLDRASPDVD
ncbi:hypothetical protein ACCO45_006888 [Purpureocillium lilacinum]|uniref:Uncharacterized protein n=1 Tax=Purpureocillium lilacinum TaxID=33203 RepID=A0ACC4DQR9_PURLI